MATQSKLCTSCADPWQGQGLDCGARTGAKRDKADEEAMDELLYRARKEENRQTDKAALAKALKYLEPVRA